MFDTPILLLIYKSQDTTLQVFEEIRKAKPSKLFVVAEGPKTPAEKNLCQQTRHIISKVDWDCDVKMLLRDDHLGDKYSVSSGLNWVFTQVDEAIILDDNCLPCESFFSFCAELLERYRDDARVMHITGKNFNNKERSDDSTYHFSKYMHIWGWATWKRAWGNYDPELKDAKFYSKLIKTTFKEPFERLFWHNFLRDLSELDSWDYKWLFSIWEAQGICANTNHNFVLNIGIDKNDTNPIYRSPYINLPTRNLAKIVHPKQIKADVNGELYFLKTIHDLEKRGYWNYFLMLARNFLGKKDGN